MIPGQAPCRFGEDRLVEHAEVLGEAAPGALQREVTNDLALDSAFGQRQVEAGDRIDRRPRQIDRIQIELGRPLAQEVEHLESLR